MTWDAASGLRPNPGIGTHEGLITDRRPDGARVIDLTGHTLLPGLIDMHVHALGGTFAGEMMLGAGVTSARDVGSYLSGVLDQRDSAAAGERMGPRLFVTGPYLVGGAAASDQERSAGGPGEVIGVVADLSNRSVDGIKLHWGIDEATLESAVTAARRRGLWVAVHLDRVVATRAAELDVDTIEHCSGIDLFSGSLEETIATLVERGVAVTPTLVVAENAFEIATLARSDNPMLAYFPSLIRKFWIRSQIINANAADLTGTEIEKRKARLRNLQEFVARFHNAGGVVLAGSDAPAYLVPPGFGLHRELELMVAAGMHPADALTAATQAAARSLGKGSEIGRLAAGMRADLLAVRGNPLEEPDGIGAIRQVAMVVTAGRVAVDRLH